MKRGYVFDVISIFTLVVVFTLVIGLGAYLSFYSQDLLQDKIAEGRPSVLTPAEYNEKVIQPFQGLDFVVPLLVGVICLGSIISGYLSQSPSVLIILFFFMAIIAIVAITYINPLLTEIWEFIQTSEGRVLYPYTTFTINNMPIILGITLALTAIFMHNK